ncbi:MAG: S24 family peptidase [Pseudomonadota bacterium]
MKRTHGGTRSGSGRPPGSGKFGEPTRMLRVPESAVPGVVSYLDHYRLQKLADAVPFESLAQEPPRISLAEYTTRVAAGSPSYADAEPELGRDLNEILIDDPRYDVLHTVEEEGDSMNLAGIGGGDRLVVNTRRQARDGDIVIAIVLGEGATIKRLRFAKDCTRLVPESSNPRHKMRELREGEEWMVWGVVRWCIKKL